MYKSALNLLETEIAIKFIKDTFEKELAKALKLTRVSAPLFVQPETGLNDNLNGYERAVRFDVLTLHKEVEIVQSLAKWKRMALSKYGFEPETGLYTDMNAIRRDEDLDCIHSVYVDQWDWEKIITKEDRKLSYLKKTVKSIFKALKKLAVSVNKKYPQVTHNLPDEITFISTSELEKEYPDLTRKERESAAAKKYGAIFLYKIGWPLKDGKPHDGRAADYDDWKLNGDIILWYDVLGIALEISSMGIRVDGESLKKQLKKKGELDKLENPYCKGILDGTLPLTIGGGIGQSRLCMYFLNKAHIGEVQSSVWSEECIKENSDKGIHLL
ncbi:MAG: aspartate--ammonia ligase [Clostridia bacterium]|nr:aspartate--ammonia ligase [Clostridia bacterium]MBR2449475.1 aspartate--ammonia ligase [Clostridia bacterium]